MEHVGGWGMGWGRTERIHEAMEWLLSEAQVGCGAACRWGGCPWAGAKADGVGAGDSCVQQHSLFHQGRRGCRGTYLASWSAAAQPCGCGGIFPSPSLCLKFFFFNKNNYKGSEALFFHNISALRSQQRIGGKECPLSLWLLAFI